MIDRFGKQIVSPLDQLYGFAMKVCDLCRDIDSQPVVRLFFGPSGAEDKNVMSSKRLYSIGIDACNRCGEKLSRSIVTEIISLNRSVLPESFEISQFLSPVLPS